MGSDGARRGRDGGGRGAALAMALAGAMSAGACASNAASQGWVAEDVDPATGEARLVLADLESGGVAITGYALADHAGTLLDVAGSHEIILWQGASEVTFVAGRAQLDVGVTERELDSARDPVIGVDHWERVSVILDDAELAWIVAHATTQLELVIGRTSAAITGTPLATLRRFAQRAVTAHGGREGMPPLVPPSDR